MHKTLDPTTRLPDASLWLFLNQHKRRKTRSLHLCDEASPTHDCAPSSYISPWTPHGRRAQLWRHQPTAFSPPLVEDESHLFISSKFCLRIFFVFISWRLITLHVSIFFIQLQGAEKAKSFGSKTLNTSHWPSKAIAIMGLSDSPLLSQPAV